MATMAQIEAILRSTDRLLATAEDLVIRAVERHLRASLRDLEARLARLRDQARDASRISDTRKREAAARLLVAQLEAALEAFDLGATSTGIPSEMRALILDSQRTGIDSANRLLRAYEDSLDLRASIDLDAVRAAAENVQARLSRHSEDFRRQAEDLIVRGIVRGEGPRKTAASLREATGILQWEAERITRTEGIFAADASQRATYERAGLSLVQVCETMDRRVCGFCAYRHMRVYKIEDCPIPQHPHCRGAALPWREEWLSAGLVDLAGIQASAAKMRERYTGPLHRGQTSAEKYAGKDAAVAVWSPPSALKAA